MASSSSESSSETLTTKAPIEIARNGSVKAVEDLLTAIHLSKSERDLLQRETSSQSESKLWLLHRQGRITASKIKSVYTRVHSLKTKSNQSSDNIVLQILRYKSGVQTIAMEHGISSEPTAKISYIDKMKKKHKNFEYKDIGLIVDGEKQFLACSPDLLIDCECHGPGLCEIKCPYSLQDQTPTHQNYQRHLVENSTGGSELSTKSEYYYQIQFQMGITGYKYCDLFVFPTEEGIEPHLERITFDGELFEEMVSRSEYLWRKHVAPELLSGRLDPSYQQPFNVPTNEIATEEDINAISDNLAGMKL